MRHLRNLTLASAFCLPLFFSLGVDAQGEASTPEKDIKALQGTWFLVRSELAGVETYPGKKSQNKKKDSAKSVLVFKNNTVSDGPKQRFDPFKLDANKSPKQIDFTIGDNVILGIYKIENDNLFICTTSVNETDRPTDFRTGKLKDGIRILVQYRKEPATVQPPIKP